jgi:hypothetical protein
MKELIPVSISIHAIEVRLLAAHDKHHKETSVLPRG